MEMLACGIEGNAGLCELSTGNGGSPSRRAVQPLAASLRGLANLSTLIQALGWRSLDLATAHS